MTRDKFDKLFKEWRVKLWLQLWDINYKRSELGERTWWQNTLNYEYIEADLIFPERLLKKKSDYIEKTIIHELLHCYLWFYTRPIELMNINKDQREVINIRFKDREETTVCQLQNIIYNLKYNK